ncbi:MAG: hypothetical protein FWH46_00820 [Methanimicrococcus sp.]|nr:hypothetical protein [Methanimicrococcus sp.]
MPVEEEKLIEYDSSFNTSNGWGIFQTLASDLTSDDSNNSSFEYVRGTSSIRHVSNFRSYSYYSDFNIEHSGETTTYTSRMIIMDDGEDTVVWFDVDGIPSTNKMWYMYTYKDWLDGKRPEKPDIEDDPNDPPLRTYPIDDFF